MKKPDLQLVGSYWQKRLRVPEWRITFKYVRDLCNAAGDKVYGLCAYIVDNKTATIMIRDPETPANAGEDPCAQAEKALIHEISHLLFAPFGASRPAEVAAEEHAVWTFADALYDAKGTPRETHLARSMVAHAKSVGAKRFAASASRRTGMDIAMFMAALEAALTAEDPKAAIEALLAKVKELSGGGGADTAPAMAEDDPNKDVMGAIAAMRAEIAELRASRATPATVVHQARQAAGPAPELREMRQERIRAMAERHAGVVSAETERRYLDSADADGFSTLIKEVQRNATAPRQRSAVVEKGREETPQNGVATGLSDFELYMAGKGGVTPEKFAAAKARQASARSGRKG